MASEWVLAYHVENKGWHSSYLLLWVGKRDGCFINTCNNNTNSGRCRMKAEGFRHPSTGPGDRVNAESPDTRDRDGSRIPLLLFSASQKN